MKLFSVGNSVVINEVTRAPFFYDELAVFTLNSAIGISAEEGENMYVC